MRWDLVAVTGFYAAFGTLLQRTSGHYNPVALVLAITAWAVCVVALAWPARAPAAPGLVVLFGLATIYDLYLSARFERLFYVVDAGAWRLGRAALLLALVLAVVLAALTFRSPADSPARVRATHLVGAAAVLAVFAARALVVSASPSPHVDVFTTATRGADFLLGLHNPYAQSYPDIYAGQYGYQPAYVYAPGVLLPETIARWLFGDIRWALIAADVVTAAGLGRIAERLGASVAVRWWLPLLWLSFPAAAFSREQAWVDPLLIATLVVVAALLLEHRVMAAGAALGYACAVKQYALIAAVLAVLAVAFACDRRRAVRFALAAAAVAAAVIGPFLLADPDSFVRATVITPLAQDVRDDALTVTAGLVRCCGVRISGAPMLALGVTAAAAGAMYLRRVGARDWPLMLRAWCAACTFVYGVTFFFGKQAFLNYYEFLLIFPVLWLTLKEGSRGDQRDAHTIPGAPP